MPSPRWPGAWLLTIAAGSGRDIWAAGYTFKVPDCLILYWDGTAWTPSPLPQPSACTLRTVAAVRGSCAWAIGTWSLRPHHYQRGLILHWNGKTWT